MKAHRIATALAVLALGSAGCGGGDSRESSPPDIASKPAKQILSDVAAAIGDLRSYRIEGTQVDEDGRSRLAGDIKASGSMRFSIVTGRSRARMIVAGSEMYMKANRAFWLARDSDSPENVADLLSDRWVKLPAVAAALYVSAVGSPLPLREVQTGPPKPGKPDRRCDSDGDPSTTTRSDIRFSNFNEPVRIAAPSSYLDLAKVSNS